MLNQFKLKQWLIRSGIVLVAFVLLFVNPALARTQNGNGSFRGKEVVANEVLVKFRVSTSQESIASVKQNENIDVDEEVGDGSIQLLHSRSKDVATLVNELSARGDVVYAEPNYVVHASALPNDPLFSLLWGLRNIGQNIGCGEFCFGSPVGTPGADISVVSAWDISTGSRANVVAVVDTGIDYNHPDLAANVWSAPTAFTVRIGGITITCAAGTHGFNALRNTCNPLDDNDHGSHVSGTIGAVGNNGIGVAGINWTASIMGAKFLSASGSGTLAGAINAIEFTIQAKQAFASTAGANVRVLSNSWGGGGFSQALLDEINKANASNMLFVAAAGNSSANNDITPAYPASFNAPNVVAVAATDNTDALAWFSNFGPTSVHLGAPGVDVLSTIIGGLYDYFSGTSMATPHVSGAAALVLSRCSLDTAALKSNLLNNVDLISSLTGRTVTGGRLNVNKAIRACSAPVAPDYAISATPASQTIIRGASTSYTVTATPSGGFTGSVAFSVSGLPANATASFSPSSVITPGSSAMAVITTATTPAGNYLLTVTGISGLLTHTAAVTLIVSTPPPPIVTISANPTSITLSQSSTLTWSSTNATSCTASNAWSGTKPTTGSEAVIPGTLGTFTYILTCIGLGGSATNSATVTVNAPPTPDFSLSISPSSVSVPATGGTASYTVTITRSGGFSAAITLSANGLPAGAVDSFSPNPASGNASTLTITVSSATIAGSYPFVVTGTGGSPSLTRTATATLVKSSPPPPPPPPGCQGECNN